MREVFRIYYIFYLFMYPLANWIGWNPLVGQALGIGKRGNEERSLLACVDC
jgi:hypothetical protein